MTVGELARALEYLHPDTPVCVATDDWGWMAVKRVSRPEDAVDGDDGFQWFTLWPADYEVDPRDVGYEQPAPTPPFVGRFGRHERTDWG